MRSKYLPLLLLVLIAQHVKANNYIPGAEKAPMAYCFELSDSAMLSIVRGVDSIALSTLTSPIDSCSPEHFLQAKTSARHPLWVVANGASLYFQATNNAPFNAFFYTLGEKLAVKVVDLEGNIVENADVRFNKKRMKFSPTTKLYECSRKALGRRRNAKILISLGGSVLEGQASFWSTARPYRHVAGKKTKQYSWMVVDKPRYRPSDLLRWKANVISQKGVAEVKDFSLNIIDPYAYGTNAVIKENVCTVERGIDGVYYGELKVDADLGLKSGYPYSLQLKHGDITVLCSFVYEDYELKSLRAEVIPSTHSYQIGDTICLHLKAFDEKDQPIAASTAKVTVWEDYTNAAASPLFCRATYESKLYDVALDDGSAILYIPTADMPRLNCNLRFSCQITTPDAQMLNAYCFCSVHPAEQQKQEQQITTDDLLPEISTFESADTVGFNVISRSRAFAYFITKNGKPIESGNTDSLEWRQACSEDALFEIEVACESYDLPFNLSRSIKHYADMLKVQIDAPDEVRPGSEAVVKIKVTDSQGRPVPNADLTLFAQTAKFNDAFNHPNIYWKKQIKQKIYSLGKASWERQYYLKSRTDITPELKSVFRLDTSVVYSLLTTPVDSIFTYSRPVDTKITQIAPFVVDAGAVDRVAMLYIDHVLVWAGFYGFNNAYSFPVSAGRHTITMRTANAEYTLTDIEAVEGAKTWVAIHAVKEKKPYVKGRITYNPRKVDFDAHEQFLLDNSINSVSVYPTNGLPYLVSDVAPEVAVPLTRADYLCNPPRYARYYQTSYSGEKTSMPWRFLAMSHTTILPADSALVFDSNSNRFNFKKAHNLSTPSLADSVLRVEDIERQWIQQIDERRARTSNATWCSDCDRHINFARNDLERNKQLINIVIKTDSQTIFVGANRIGNVALASPQCSLHCLFANGGRISFDLTLNKGEDLFVNLDSLDLNAVVIDSLSRALEHESRLYVETTSRDNNSYFQYLSLGTNTRISSSMRVYGSAKSKAVYTEVAGGAMKPSSIRIRGISSINAPAADDALMLFEEEVEELSEEEVVAFGMENKEFALRSNFNDVAFWTPDATTNVEGEAEIKVAFPDDLTLWRTYAVAIRGTQRGWATTNIKATLPAAATLSVPRFVIEGDSVYAIGQTIIYNGTQLDCAREFVSDSLTIKEIPSSSITLQVADTALFVAPQADTIAVSYKSWSSEFADGERREIPVYRPGLEEINATFNLLSSGDTSFIIRANSCDYVEIYAAGSVLPSLIAEVEQYDVKHHTSNDHMASLLKVLLAKEKIAAFRNTRFTESKEIKTLIKKLLDARSEHNYWCWWGKCNSHSHSLWVTSHILSALREAQKAGYQVDMSTSEAQKARLVDEYTQAVQKHAWHQALSILKIIQYYLPSSEMAVHISAIPVDSLSSYQITDLLSLTAQSGLTVDMHRYDSIMHNDLLGGCYYQFNMKYDHCYFSDHDALATTIAAYHGWLASPSSPERTAMLRKLELWMLRSRRGGRWQNTLQSTEIVALMLQRMEETGASIPTFDLQINDEKIETQSYSKRFTSLDSVKVTKRGNDEVYFSYAEFRWNRNPEPSQGNFTIATDWQTPTLLTRAQPATLTVTVSVDAEAEYVCVSVPIPAGCSYADSQPYCRMQTSREAYRNVVNVYFERLSAGTHEIKINLVPRWSGVYTLNPAQVKMIYFPAFNANNKSSKVTIK